MFVLYDLVNCHGNQRNVMTSARTALPNEVSAEP